MSWNLLTKYLVYTLVVILCLIIVVLVMSSPVDFVQTNSVYQGF